MRRPLSVLLVALSLAAVAPLPAGASIRPGRYAIGDSVMLGARSALRARGFVVNAEVSRQFAEAVTIVRQLARDGRLRRTIVIHLGTNGVLIAREDCDTIARIAGRHRRVYLVTIGIPRSYRQTQNDRMRACAARHANTSVIDWYAHSRNHPAWFYSDGYHLNARGQAHYAAFLDRRAS
jgi:hypothetical protein